MFEFLKTGIDGLDAILGGGIRFPTNSSAFVFASGGTGSGKTLMALEILTRAWLNAEDGSTVLYYSVEHAPQNLHAKLEADFNFYGMEAEITELPQEVSHKVCLEAKTKKGRSRLVLTQADTAGMTDGDLPGFRIDVDWILAEIDNYHLGGKVAMVCIDNVGLLLTDLDYFSKRAKLLQTRRDLMSKQIHGLFVQEESDPQSLRLPSAEEFSTDVLIHLSFREDRSGFHTRNLEVVKARHQYYYRGPHQFSVAGRDLRRDVYLGARNERGPGLHVYPSVPAQLSIARDRAGFRVPSRGNTPIDMGHPDINQTFLEGEHPNECSSTVILAEPGTRYTFLAMRFLAAARKDGEKTLMISTKEDREALRRICNSDPMLKEHCLRGEDHFHSDFRVLYLHPEYISAGKFTWDIMRLTHGGHGGEGAGTPQAVKRLAFDNTYRLQDRFPLISDPKFMISALLDQLRYLGVTPLMVDLVPNGSGMGRASFDPAPYMVNFDNVIHLYHDDKSGESKPKIRVMKSTGHEYLHPVRGLRYDA